MSVPRRRRWPRLRPGKADTEISSPIDGFVVSREVEFGTAVSPGSPILKLADPASIWVTVFIDERDAGSLAVGDVADVALRSIAGRTFSGKVARIRRESDRVTEQLTVDIRFDDRPGRLTLGEQAEATIQPSGEKSPGVAVDCGGAVAQRRRRVDRGRWSDALQASPFRCGRSSGLDRGS